MTQDEIVERNVFKVRLFIDAWRAIDPDMAMACLSDDIVSINQPLEPLIGQGGCPHARRRDHAALTPGTLGTAQLLWARQYGCHRTPRLLGLRRQGLGTHTALRGSRTAGRPCILTDTPRPFHAALG